MGFSWCRAIMIALILGILPLACKMQDRSTSDIPVALETTVQKSQLEQIPENFPVHGAPGEFKLSAFSTDTYILSSPTGQFTAPVLTHPLEMTMPDFYKGTACKKEQNKTAAPCISEWFGEVGEALCGFPAQGGSYLFSVQACSDARQGQAEFCSEAMSMSAPYTLPQSTSAELAQQFTLLCAQRSKVKEKARTLFKKIADYSAQLSKKNFSSEFDQHNCQILLQHISDGGEHVFAHKLSYYAGFLAEQLDQVGGEKPSLSLVWYHSQKALPPPPPGPSSNNNADSNKSKNESSLAMRSILGFALLGASIGVSGLSAAVLYSTYNPYRLTTYTRQADGTITDSKTILTKEEWLDKSQKFTAAANIYTGEEVNSLFDEAETGFKEGKRQELEFKQEVKSRTEVDSERIISFENDKKLIYSGVDEGVLARSKKGARIGLAAGVIGGALAVWYRNSDLALSGAKQNTLSSGCLGPLQLSSEISSLDQELQQLTELTAKLGSSLNK